MTYFILCYVYMRINSFFLSQKKVIYRRFPIQASNLDTGNYHFLKVVLSHFQCMREISVTHVLTSLNWFSENIPSTSV